MDSFLILLYEAVLGLALLLAGPVVVARRPRHYLPTLSGRLWGKEGGEERKGAGAGGEGAESGRPLWIHAVSVGEVGVAAVLARALPGATPLLVTTVTPTGQALARKLFAGRARVAYLPFDLRPLMRRFWRRHRPAALILVEGDYWPVQLALARRQGVPVAVVNGRVGDRSFDRMRRLRPLVRFLFAAVGQFGVQSAEDRDRLRRLGIEEGRLYVTGNLKFESPEPAVGPGLQALMAALRGIAGGRPLLVAGSTMGGEEEQVLAAFLALGGGERALLLVAPRHPERWDEAERLLRQPGVAVQRRSALGTAAGAVGAAGTPPNPGGGFGGRIDVVLLDSMGELAALYQLAAAAFIGGTLAPTGGHNPLEPARYGIPTAVGPSMHNFRDMATRFDAAGAWRRVAGTGELAEAWRDWLDHPDEAIVQGQRAAALLRENRGALARTLDMLAPILALVAAGTGAAGRTDGGAETPAAATAGGPARRHGD